MNPAEQIHEQSLPFMPDLSEEQRRQAQVDTAEAYGLEPFFADEFVDGGKGPALAVIPAGSFEMGAPASEFGFEKTESPQHYVAISYPYALGRYTITAQQFEVFRAETHWHLRGDLIWAEGNNPVINVRRSDAKLFIKWLNKKTGQRYRLPTEAEWEYAARAGTSSAFYFGDSASCKEVHFNPNFPYEEAKEKKRWFFPRCFPMPKALDVGLLPANLWGLHEMHGNVWEYTASPWTSSHFNARRDGGVDRSSENQWLVTKGGSWFDPATLSRSACRRPRLKDEMDVNLGFRVLRELI